MSSNKNKLIAIRQTLKDLLYVMNNIDDKMKKIMEKAIDSFIDERVSTFISQELNDKFSNGKKAIVKQQFKR